MIILILILAVTNIVLGLWLAIRLGFGPPTLADAWDTLVCVELAGDTRFLAATDLANHLDELLDDEPEDDDFEVECVVVESVETEKEIELDYEVSDMLEPFNPEYWDLDEKFIETSIVKLVIAAIKNGVQATTTDTKLRNERDKATRELIESSQESLLEDCRVYLAEQEDASEDLRKRLSTFSNQSLAREVSDSLERQAQQLTDTMARIRAIDLEAEPVEGVDSLLGELNQLRVTRHEALDAHHELFLQIARSEERLDTIDANLQEDHLMKLHNRLGLEVTLADWFARKRHHHRQLNAAIFDIHDFTNINNHLGILISDKILIHVGQQIREMCGADDLVGRFTGQQIMVIYSDIGVQAAIKKSEMFRQTIKESVFMIYGQPCSIELNFAFTEIKPGDENEQVVLKRLLEALDQSKRAGPDTSFLHDGNWTQQIESPSLRTKPKTIVL